jgi:polar amino acid transport system substrate-binding protein
MKKLIAVVAVVALAAAVVTALGVAATSGAGAATATPEAKKRPKLPPLPSNIRRRGRLLIGVKCDAPPFGYINVRGENAGFDVEIARWFSRYAFGSPNRLRFECTPTPAREPAITTGRVDMVIATFTYTRDRDTRIDFSRAYYKATGRLLVKNDGPVQRLNDIRGRRIATTSGSIYDRWMRRCFPTAEVITVDSVTSAILAFNQGRADAVMFDDAALLAVAAADQTAKMTNDTFLEGPYGIGMRQGYTALKRWVDARLAVMKQKDVFLRIIRNNLAPRFVPTFSANILRPRVNFGYPAPGAPSADTVCP